MTQILRICEGKSTYCVPENTRSSIGIEICEVPEGDYTLTWKYTLTKIDANQVGKIHEK